MPLITGLLSIALIMYDVYSMDLKAGALAMQNYYTYSYVIAKTYNRFSPHSIGVLLAFFYE